MNRKTLCAGLVFSLVLLWGLPAQEFEVRHNSDRLRALVSKIWTDSSGKFTVDAELTKLSGDKIVLRKKDGKEIVVRLNVLSKSDQDHIIKKIGLDGIDLAGYWQDTDGFMYEIKEWWTEFQLIEYRIVTPESKMRFVRDGGIASGDYIEGGPQKPEIPKQTAWGLGVNIPKKARIIRKEPYTATLTENLTIRINGPYKLELRKVEVANAPVGSKAFDFFQGILLNNLADKEQSLNKKVNSRYVTENENINILAGIAGLSRALETEDFFEGVKAGQAVARSRRPIIPTTENKHLNEDRSYIDEDDVFPSPSVLSEDHIWRRVWSICPEGTPRYSRGALVGFYTVTMVEPLLRIAGKSISKEDYLAVSRSYMRRACVHLNYPYQYADRPLGLPFQIDEGNVSSAVASSDSQFQEFYADYVGAMDTIAKHPDLKNAEVLKDLNDPAKFSLTLNEVLYDLQVHQSGRDSGIWKERFARAPRVDRLLDHEAKDSKTEVKFVSINELTGGWASRLVDKAFSGGSAAKPSQPAVTQKTIEKPAQAKVKPLVWGFLYWKPNQPRREAKVTFRGFARSFPQEPSSETVITDDRGYFELKYLGKVTKVQLLLALSTKTVEFGTAREGEIDIIIPAD